MIISVLDASARIPRGILLGNLQDLGNYDQCLNINEYLDSINIQGKYCMTELPVTQNMLNRLRFLEQSYIDETIPDFHENNRNLFTSHDLNRRINPIFGIQGFDSRLVFSQPRIYFIYNNNY